MPIEFYHGKTRTLLRRYRVICASGAQRWSGHTGLRVGKVRGYRSFEAALILVLDVDRCLSRLSEVHQKIIRMCVVGDTTQARFAAEMGMSLRTACRRFTEALSEISSGFLRAKLIDPFPAY